MKQRYSYGGQAVIEGVMIRGRQWVTLAVRRPRGDIYTQCEPLSGLYTGALRRVPFIRGIIVLVETLVLGARALNRSATIATEGDGEGEGDAAPQEAPRWLFPLTMVVSLALGIGLFMVVPLGLVRFLDPIIDAAITSRTLADIASNFTEGIIRLAILVGYIWGIGLLPDIRRVFAYHGAEHMAVHAHENGDPLDAEHVRRYPTAHPRCGTAFLLTVMVVSVVVFSFLGRPEMVWRILSRIVLVPVIAAISYEVIRFSGFHRRNPLVHLITAPSLWLQALTTRQPDDGQIEVAIRATELAVAADEGHMPATAEAPQSATKSVPHAPTAPMAPAPLLPKEGPIPQGHIPSTNGHQDATR